MEPVKRMGLTAVAAVLAALLFGCSRKPAPPPAPKPPADRVWTPEEMAKDPEGYLVWADAKVQSQSAASEARLKTLRERMEQVRARKAQLDENLAGAENIRARMEQNIRRGEDEDREPFEMAGERFTIEQGRQVVAGAQRYIENNRPLAQKYDELVGKFEAAVEDLAGKIDAMRRMHERLGLDIEQVRLNQGSTETEKLNQTQAEIGGFATALTRSEETIGLAALAGADKQPDKVDIHTFLKK
jgi:hypothetical protein